MIRHFVDSVNRFIRGWSNRPTWVLALRSVLSLGGFRHLLLPTASRWLHRDQKNGDTEISPNQHRNHSALLCKSKRAFLLAYSPDGQRIVTASRDGTFQIYTTGMNGLLEIAKSRVTRQLTELRKKKDIMFRISDNVR